MATRTTVIAHRGRNDKHAENTLSAVRSACDGSADVVEIDVHLTRDAEVVVIHDRTVDRTTDGTGRVGSMTLEDLRTLDAGRAGAPEPVPLLREVLDELAKSPSTRLLIELKFAPWRWRGVWCGSTAPVRPIAGLARAVVDELRSHHSKGGIALEQIVVQSFVASYLDEVRHMESGIERHLLLPPLLLRLPLRADVSALNIAARQVSKQTVAKIHAAGKKVNVWTVDEEEDMRRCIAAGVDGIITNNVPLLREVLLLTKAGGTAALTVGDAAVAAAAADDDAAAAAAGDDDE